MYITAETPWVLLGAMDALQTKCTQSSAAEQVSAGVAAFRPLGIQSSERLEFKFRCGQVGTADRQTPVECERSERGGRFSAVCAKPRPNCALGSLSQEFK